MNNKFLKLVGIGVCALALGLNLQHAFEGYGVKKGNLHPEVWAQTTGGDSTGGGSGTATGGGSSSGGSSSSSDCPKTVINGTIITTTVCNRKTSTAGVLLNVKCDTDAETSCSFTNVGAS